MKKFKVGYTTGVFDLFHIGTFNILEKSKRTVDHLIVVLVLMKLFQGYKRKHQLFHLKKELLL